VFTTASASASCACSRAHFEQLQQRVKREHGRAFDQLVRKARK
jgi:hypothetical protein